MTDTTKEPAQRAYEAFHARVDAAASWPSPSWDEAGPIARNNWRVAFDAGVDGLLDGANVNDLPVVQLEDENPPAALAESIDA